MPVGRCSPLRTRGGAVVSLAARIDESRGFSGSAAGGGGRRMRSGRGAAEDDRTQAAILTIAMRAFLMHFSEHNLSTATLFSVRNVARNLVSVNKLLVNTGDYGKLTFRCNVRLRSLSCAAMMTFLT